jgi:hypothetical protein
LAGACDEAVADRIMSPQLGDDGFEERAAIVDVQWFGVILDGPQLLVGK